MKRKIAALVVLLAKVLTVFAFAEEKVTSKEVVISATRTEAELEEVPASMTIVREEEIRIRGAQKLKDIIDLTPSIYKLPVMRREGAAISIRGFDPKHTQILIDGRRIVGEVDGRYEIERQTLQNVERIEILRGPASALYGSDAMGGVINIITKTEDRFSFDLMPKYGFYRGGKGDQLNVVARLNSGKIGRFRFTLSGSILDKDPLFAPDGSRTWIEDAEQKDLSLKMIYDLTSKTRLIFDGDYIKEDAEDIFLSGGILQNNLHDNTRYGLSLSLVHKSEEMDYFLRFYGSRYDKDYEARDKTGTTPNRLRSFDEAKRDLYVAEGKISKILWKNHHLTLGGEFRKEAHQGTRVKTGKGRYVVTREGIRNEGSKIDIDYYGVYLQDEWVITEKLLLIPGIRYDDSDAFEGEISPKVGITYKVLPNLRLKFVYGHGYKIPNTNNLFIDFYMGRAYRVLGNPDLKPETTDSFEVAVESEWSRFSGRVAYFYNDVDDLVDPVRITCPAGTIPGVPCMTYQNIKKAEIQGVEVEAGMKVFDDLYLKSYYTFLKAKDKESGDRLEHRPRHKIGAKLTYDNKRLGLRANLWWDSLYGLLWTATPKVEKKYSLWNIGLAKDITKNIELYAGADNLFDKKDRDIPLPGVFYFVGMRVRF